MFKPIPDNGANEPYEVVPASYPAGWRPSTTNRATSFSGSAADPVEVPEEAPKSTAAALALWPNLK
jgi:hypothetical protein